MNGKRAPLLGIAVLLCAAFALVACDDESSQGPRPPLVSADAAFALIVDRPAALLNEAAELWDAAQLDKSYGANLMDFLLKNIPVVEEIAATVDRGRSLALVVLPKSPGSSEYRTLFFLPLKEGKEDNAKDFESGGMRLVRIELGYAIYSNGDETEDDSIEFPPQKPLDTSALGKYPSDAIKLWASPKTYATSLAGGFAGFARAGKRFVKPGDDSDATSRLADWGISMLDQLGSADGAIVISRTGITLKAQARPDKGSEAERLILLEAAAPSAIEWAGQIEARALFGLSWSTTPEFSAALSDIMATMPGMADTPQLAARRALLKDLEAKARGSRGAFSFDVRLDQAALESLDSRAGQDEIKRAIDRFFHFDFEFLGELRDARAYVSLLNAVFEDKAFLDALHSSAEGKGLTISLDAKRRDEKGTAAGEVSFGFDLSNPEKMGITEPAQVSVLRAVFASFSDKFAFRWSTAGGRFALANTGWDNLAALSARPKSPKSVLDDPAFKAFASGLPSRTQYLLSISTARLMGLLKSTLSPDSVDPEEFDCWYGYLSAASAFGQAVLEIGFFVPASDIRATLESITAPEPAATKKPAGRKS